MEVAQPTGDALIGQTAQQMKDLDLMSVSIVNFKASKSGITITDSSTGYVCLILLHPEKYAWFYGNEPTFILPNF